MLKFSFQKIIFPSGYFKSKTQVFRFIILQYFIYLDEPCPCVEQYLMTVVPVQRLFLVVLLLLDSVVFVFTRGITFLTGGHFVIVLTVTVSLYLTLGRNYRVFTTNFNGF